MALKRRPPQKKSALRALSPQKARTSTTKRKVKVYQPVKVNQGSNIPRYYTKEMLDLADAADAGKLIGSSDWTVKDHVQFAIEAAEKQSAARADAPSKAGK